MSQGLSVSVSNLKLSKGVMDSNGVMVNVLPLELLHEIMMSMGLGDKPLLQSG